MVFEGFFSPQRYELGRKQLPFISSLKQSTNVIGGIKSMEYRNAPICNIVHWMWIENFEPNQWDSITHSNWTTNTTPNTQMYNTDCKRPMGNPTDIL